VVVCEVLHSCLIFPQMSKGWEAGYDPGNFGLDPFKMTNDRQRTAELKNGRLAMLAFSGLVTQAALTGGGFPYTG